jgi:uncharacterized membrane protein
MLSHHLHYLPAPVLLYLLLGGLLVGVLLLLQIGLLDRAYRSLGLEPRVATLVLLASLFGGYLNIPIARLPEARRVVASAYVDLFGVPYLVPQIVDWPGTIVAINVGGAAIPIALSIYLISRYRLLAAGAIATAVVAVVVHRLAQPIPGVGVVVPWFWPPILAALAALILSRRHAAPLAYIGGSLGVLIGADLTNLDQLQNLGAPVASIGGAGAFDSVFLTGVVAALLSGLAARRAA